MLLRTARVDPLLRKLRDLTRLLATVAVGTGIVAIAYVGVFLPADKVAWTGVSTHFLRFWIGDMIGVVATTPLILVLAARTLRFVAAGEMASALAHELNQPLSAIGRYLRACQLMLRRSDTDRVRPAQTMEKVVAEATRAGDVVHRLRDFFRTGTSRLEHVSISELLSSGIGPVRKCAERQQMRLRLDLANAAAAPAVLEDRLQLEIVIHNLVANAIGSIAAAHAPQREVSVTARGDAREVRVEVRDTGPGVAPGIAARLFEPFATSRPQGMGMGLGLALSRSIIEARGGRLQAVSDARGGAFSFTLPLGHREGQTTDE